MKEGIKTDLGRRIRQLRLRDLQLLEEIHRHGTMQGASRALFVSQPAVSQALRALEQTLGATLAVRSRQGVRLTDAGHALRVHLLAADASLAAGLAAIGAAAPRPVLRLGTIPYGLTEAVPQALARLGQAPFTLHIGTGAVDALRRGLSNGQYDAILTRLAAERPGTRPIPPPAPELAIWPVTSMHTAIACPRQHPLARRRPSLAQLAQADWVLPDAGTVVREAFDDLFARAGLAPPHPRVVTPNYADNLRIAAAAGLLTVAPLAAIAPHRPAVRPLLVPPHWAAQVVLASLPERAEWPPIAALRAALAAAERTRTPRRDPEAA